MRRNPGPVVCGAVVALIVIAISGSIRAQEMKDRELRPEFDFTTIQMPVEIVSIKLNGTEVQPGEKIKGDDDWLQGLSFTLKNISDKPIAYVAVTLLFRRPERVVGFVLSYGVDYSRGEPRRASSPRAIPPGETVNLVLTKERYASFLEIMASAGMLRSVDVAPYLIDRASFEDDPDVIWEGGYLKRRNPTVIGRFDKFERYVLPAKEK